MCVQSQQVPLSRLEGAFGKSRMLSDAHGCSCLTACNTYNPVRLQSAQKDSKVFMRSLHAKAALHEAIL